MTVEATTVIRRVRYSGARRPIDSANLLRSEWVKLRSVRSTYLTGAAVALATVALAAVTCWRYRWLLAHGQDGGGFDPTALTLNGTRFAQLAAGALGVLTVSSEYSTGMIRASLCAVPRRQTFLAAKATVFAAVTVAVGAALSFAAFGIGQAIIAGRHAGSSLNQPGVLRAIAGAALYLTVVGLLGFGLGAAIRHTAGALTALFALLFVPTGIVDILPLSWHPAVEKYLPVNAGSQAFTVPHNPRFLGPWTGLGVFSLYAFVAVTVAAVLIQRRDA